MEVTLKGFWLDTNYMGRPAKTLLVCGVEIGAVSTTNGRPGFTAWAWPRYGGLKLDLPMMEKCEFSTEAEAMEWVKETVENAPPPEAYLKLVAS